MSTDLNTFLTNVNRADSEGVPVNWKSVTATVVQASQVAITELQAQVKARVEDEAQIDLNLPDEYSME